MSDLRRECQEVLQGFDRGAQASAAAFDARSTNPHLTRKLVELDELQVRVWGDLFKRVSGHRRQCDPSVSVGKATEQTKG